MTKEWSVVSINTVLLGLYTLLVVTGLVPMLFANRPIYYLIPFTISLITYAIFEIKLERAQRPCGHMSIRRGGRFGLITPFIHRKCPMCGKDLLNVRI
jgi:hypothetical protein